MRKVLLLLAFLPILCFGQDTIKVHDINHDGARIIRVSPANILNYNQFTFKTDEDGISFSIYPVVTKTIHNYGKKNQRSVYSIELSSISSSRIRIEKDARLLIKKGDNSVITLKSYVMQEDNIGSMFISDRKYNITSFFIITYAQLKELASGDVSKIRVEYTYSPKNVTFKNNKFSMFIQEALKRIQDAESVKDTFLEGF